MRNLVSARPLLVPLLLVLAVGGYAVGLPWFVSDLSDGQPGLNAVGVSVGFLGCTSLFMLIGLAQETWGGWHRRLVTCAWVASLLAVPLMIVSDEATTGSLVSWAAVAGQWTSLLCLFAANTVYIVADRRRRRTEAS